MPGDESNQPARPDRDERDSNQRDRHERIAKAAYSRAEQRGFAPGADWDDWFDAEREVDAEIEQLTTRSNLPND